MNDRAPAPRPPLRLGAVFPQADLAADSGAVREYLRGVVELGFDHVWAYDHVVGAHRASHPDLAGFYRAEHLVHEVVVLLGFAAAVAPELELVAGVVVAPQRQTVLLAKQLAEVDVLSGGRLRCGVGAGHEPVQYAALGMSFEDRGRRLEEQITLRRQLWIEEYLDFDGEWHTVVASGINPRPEQRPIPLWVGGSSEAALRRAARCADGFFPHVGRPLEGGWAMTIERLHGWIAEAGRDPATFGVEPWIDVTTGSPAEWREEAESWRALGATHVGLDTASPRPQEEARSPERHLERLQEALAAIM